MRPNRPDAQSACLPAPRTLGLALLGANLQTDKTLSQLGPKPPYSRPSAGVAQEASGRDAARGVEGHGWPFSAGLRSGTGGREVWPRSGQTRMSGCPSSLVTFLLGKQQESDSGGGPKPTISERLDNSPGAWPP